MSIKILVSAHKECILRNDEVYMPIQVGKSISKIEFPFQADDEGDNISNKNGSFAELTAMYWAWKNLKHVDIIGLAHYRRYFELPRNSFQPIVIKKASEYFPQITDEKVITKILGEYDIVLAKPVAYPYNLFVDYSVCHVSEDMRTVEKIIENKYPDYVKAFKDIMYENNKLSHFNMFIMRWEQFDDYCNWLFPILKEAETLINIENYNSVQKRIFGYMAERLLCVYVKHNHLKIYYAPVVWINDERKPSNGIRYFIHRIKTNLIWSLQNHKL